MAAHLVQEELQRVGGDAGQLVVADPGRLDLLAAAVVAHLDAAALELVLQLGGLRVAQVELLGEVAQL